ncbi:MAG: OmpP1/FadL family transporter [Rhodothermaceae bacterium]
MQIIRIIVITAITFSACMAQNYLDILRYSSRNTLSNARALGMGNSVLTTGNDLSGLSYNPATLGLVKDTQFGLGLNFNSVNTKTTFFGNTFSEDKTKNNFSQLGFVAPIPTVRGSMVFGFSYERVADFTKSISFDGFNTSNTSMIKTLAYANDDLAYKLGLSFPVKENDVYKYDDTKINGNLNQNGKIDEKGYLDKVSAAFAVEMQKNLFVGITMNLYYGEYTQDRFYVESDTKDVYDENLLLDDSDERTKDFQRFEMTDRITQDVSGYGFTLGILYKMNNGLRFAGSIKSPDFFEIEERYGVIGKSIFKDDIFETTWLYSSNTYNVRTPFEFSFGTSYTRSGFSLSGNVTIINYKQMKFTDGFSSADEKEKNTVIDNSFRTVANLNFGAEYKMPNLPVSLRMGFIVNKSPYKNDASKYDKKYITAGIGYELSPQLTLDAAYLYGWWDDLGDNYGSNVSRTFQEVEKSNFSLNLGLRL